MNYHFITPKEGVSHPIPTQFDDTQPGGQSFIQLNFDVPPYPTPLNKTGDKIGWWDKHKPLFIQTVALGPIETKNSGARNPDKRLSDYSFFHGCRKITIKNNVISSIEVVHMSEIRGPRPRLCSIRELCRVRGVSFPASLHSLAEDIKGINPICDRLKAPPRPFQITVPDVFNFHPTIAERRIKNAGLRANMVGCSHQNCRVSSQDPIAGTVVPKDSTVTCTAEDITL